MSSRVSFRTPHAELKALASDPTTPADALFDVFQVTCRRLQDGKAAKHHDVNVQIVRLCYRNPNFPIQRVFAGSSSLVSAPDARGLIAMEVFDNPAFELIAITNPSIVQYVRAIILYDVGSECRSEVDKTFHEEDDRWEEYHRWSEQAEDAGEDAGLDRWLARMIVLIVAAQRTLPLAGKAITLDPQIARQIGLALRDTSPSAAATLAEWNCLPDGVPVLTPNRSRRGRWT